MQREKTLQGFRDSVVALNEKYPSEEDKRNSEYIERLANLEKQIRRAEKPSTLFDRSSRQQLFIRRIVDKALKARKANIEHFQSEEMADFRKQVHGMGSGGSSMGFSMDERFIKHFGKDNVRKLENGTVQIKLHDPRNPEPEWYSQDEIKNLARDFQSGNTGMDITYEDIIKEAIYHIMNQGGAENLGGLTLPIMDRLEVNGFGRYTSTNRFNRGKSVHPVGYVGQDHSDPAMAWSGYGYYSAPWLNLKVSTTKTMDRASGDRWLDPARIPSAFSDQWYWGSENPGLIWDLTPKENTLSEQGDN